MFFSSQLEVGHFSNQGSVHDKSNLESNDPQRRNNFFKESVMFFTALSMSFCNFYLIFGILFEILEKFCCPMT